MKLNGNIITGIFQYKEGIIYTIHDIILYQAGLYIALGDYDGKVTPDKSLNCKPYIEYLSESTSDIEGTVVTGSSLKYILNSYYKGLSGDGRLVNITIESNSKLKSYSDTGAYHATITKDVINIIPGEYILRVYHYDDNYVQQLISLTDPIMYVIVNEIDMVPKIYVIGNTNTLMKLSNLLSTTYDALVQKAKDINETIKKSFEFVELNVSANSENPTKGIIYSDLGLVPIKSNKILHVIIQLKTSIGVDNEVEYEQVPISIYISSDNMKIKYVIKVTNQVEDYIQFNLTTNTDGLPVINYEIVSNSNSNNPYRVRYAYISNGKN